MISSILFLGSQMTVGGAQRVLFNQAEWFHKKGFAVKAAFFYDKDNLKADWNAAYPFPIFDLRGWKSGGSLVSNSFRLIAGLIRLWRLLLREKIDVIETFTPDSNLVGLLAGRLAGIPVRIASHHGYIEGAGKMRKKAHGWIVNHDFAHCMVAVSERVRRIAIQEEGVRPERVKVILNGIDPVPLSENGPGNYDQGKKALGLKPDDFVYITVSRLTLQKGHTYLLDAIPRVLERFPENTVFLFAGEGHQREILQAKTTRMGLENVVKYLGVRPDIPDLLFLSDVFVMPSLWEGLPLALLEAMSAGLPVVATNVEGVEAVIIDGENGSLIPPQDVNALAAALIKMREDAAARQDYSIRNIDLVHREFTIDRMCNHYKDLFQEIYQQEIGG
jgi:glycosyltransferase involved in cell wall biosynthesis